MLPPAMKPGIEPRLPIAHARSTAFRRFAIPAILLVLSLAQGMAGVHSHDLGRADDHCALCVVAHTPIIESQGLPPAPAPERTEHRQIVAPILTPPTIALHAAPSRAPPTA